MAVRIIPEEERVLQFQDEIDNANDGKIALFDLSTTRFGPDKTWDGYLVALGDGEEDRTELNKMADDMFNNKARVFKCVKNREWRM